MMLRDYLGADALYKVQQSLVRPCFHGFLFGNSES